MVYIVSDLLNVKINPLFYLNFVNQFTQLRKPIMGFASYSSHPKFPTIY